MKRTFNYTGRQKIRQRHVTINLVDEEGSDILAFRASIDLTAYDFPPDARVYVEAYYKSSMMRFDYGSVTNVSNYALDTHSLEDLQGSNPRFRIKVVDETDYLGRLIGVSDIAPNTDETRKIEKISLLYVRYDDLGHRIWQLDVSDAQQMPVLRVNDLQLETKSMSEVVKDVAFRTLVFPQVIEQILQTIFHDATEIDETDKADWKNQWIQYAKQLTGLYLDVDVTTLTDTDIEEWIEQIVQDFCLQQSVKKFFVDFVDGEK